MENTALIPVRKGKRAPRTYKHRFSPEVGLAYNVLRLPVGSKRTAVQAAFRRVARENHPDRGGDARAMSIATAARDLLLSVLPKRGRPRKYIKADGFAIVATETGEILAQGFDTRKSAREYLKNLQLQPVTGSGSGRKSLRRIEIVCGNPSSEANRRSRARRRIRAKNQNDPHYWNKLLCDLGLGTSRGLYLADAPKGCGLLVTGGYGCEKIEAIDVAHFRGDQLRGFPARRSRPSGAGPDSFDRDDTADLSDSDACLSSHVPDRMNEEEFQNPYGRVSFGSRCDRLLNDSDEDRCFRPVDGLDAVEFDNDGGAFTVPEKIGLYIGCDDFTDLDPDEDGLNERSEPLPDRPEPEPSEDDLWEGINERIESGIKDELRDFPKTLPAKSKAVELMIDDSDEVLTSEVVVPKLPE